VLVDLCVALQLSGHYKGDGSQLFAAFRARLHSGLMRHGRFDHAVRGDPELILAVSDIVWMQRRTSGSMKQ
jgi:hypothetical protein